MQWLKKLLERNRYIGALSVIALFAGMMKLLTPLPPLECVLLAVVSFGVVAFSTRYDHW